MRVEEPRGIETLKALRPQIDATVEEQPDGLLLHERLVYGDDWHETYFRRGGFESIFVDVEPGVGMATFAPTVDATGPDAGGSCARRRRPLSNRHAPLSEAAGAAGDAVVPGDQVTR